MTANQKSPTEFASGKRHRNQLYLSAAVVGLLILGALIVLSRLNFGPVATPLNTVVPTPTDVAPLDAAPSLGPKTAPITIIEYGDFGCDGARQGAWCWILARALARNEEARREQEVSVPPFRVVRPVSLRRPHRQPSSTRSPDTEYAIVSWEQNRGRDLLLGRMRA